MKESVVGPVEVIYRHLCEIGEKLLLTAASIHGGLVDV